MSQKRKLKTLTILQKYELIKDVETGMKKKDVAQKFDIKPNTLSTILKNKTTVVEAVEKIGTRCNSKRLKKATFESVDKSVVEWFSAMRGQNLPVTGAMVKQKALEFANRLQQTNFKTSNGWLSNWKKR